MRSFDRIVGLERLRVLHLNDALRECGSRIDRHTHIGRGRIGLAGFARVLRDPRLAGLPMILETPKADASPAARVSIDRFDRMNLGVLRRLAGLPPRRLRRACPHRTPRPRT
jgi:deoxyribonuclease-4